MHPLGLVGAGVILKLGQSTIEQIDQRPVPGMTEQLLVSPLRSRLAWLESQRFNVLLADTDEAISYRRADYAGRTRGSMSRSGGTSTNVPAGRRP